MSNATTLTQLERTGQYKRDGFQEFVSEMRRECSRRQGADNLALAVASALADTVTGVTDSAASVYGIWIDSPTASTTDCKVQVFNTDDTDVTLGVTAPFMVLHCEGGKGQGYRFHPGNDGQSTFGTGVSIAATTDHDGSTAPNAADRPDVIVLYGT